MQSSIRGKWIFLSLVSLCAIVTIVVPIMTHSMRNAWYGAVAVLFIGGIYNIYLGAKKLRIERQNGQTAIWYKDYMIDIGVMCLLLGFLEVIMDGSADNLSALIGVNTTYGVTGLLGVGALIFFILFIKNRPNRSITSR